jgi:molybdate transport system substrate-binding protein
MSGPGSPRRPGCGGPRDGSRRGFVRAALVGIAGAALPLERAHGGAGPFDGRRLQVWSCGGLAETFQQLNAAYERRSGARLEYTGAFAAALGKSLLGSGRTDVFGGRVLDLARKLRAADRMAWFRPLCFTSYVLVTPRGNPAGIRSVADLARPGVRVVLAPDASPPGGQAALGILKAAGVVEGALRNAVVKGSCVQRTTAQLVAGEGDVSVVERRISRMREFDGKLEVIPIPEELFPPAPLTFTIGVMNEARDRALAEDYVAYATSAEGQAFLDRGGFIPAASAEGQRLVAKWGVRDA